MDFDANQFLTDVLDAVLALPGDPVRQIDRAVDAVIADHIAELHRLAQRNREAILDMAEERRTGKPVATKWKV